MLTSEAGSDSTLACTRFDGHYLLLNYILLQFCVSIKPGTSQTVKTIVEFCRWDDTPYPLEKTKEIIRMVDDEVETLTVPRLLTGVVTDDDGQV